MKRKTLAASYCAFALGAPLACDGDAAPPPESPVRLVLQITVDGLRGDLLQRYSRHFGDGGFRYLLDEGVVYTNAHYQHVSRSRPT